MAPAIVGYSYNYYPFCDVLSVLAVMNEYNPHGSFISLVTSEL